MKAGLFKSDGVLIETFDFTTAPFREGNIVEIGGAIVVLAEGQYLKPITDQKSS
jgi:hypothetical protein